MSDDDLSAAEQGAIIACPLFVLWWVLLSSRAGTQVEILRNKKLRAVALAGLVIFGVFIFAFVSRYALFLAWVFTLGCAAGAMFRAKRAWQLVMWGAIAIALVELRFGPMMREMERRGRRAIQQRKMDREIKEREKRERDKGPPMIRSQERIGAIHLIVRPSPEF